MTTALILYAVALTSSLGPDIIDGAIPNSPHFTLGAAGHGMEHTTTLLYEGFSILHDDWGRIPYWVQYELTAAKAVSRAVPRRNGFLIDRSLDRDSRASDSDYAGTVWERGHMAPSASMRWSALAQRQSFFLSNAAPQNDEMNGEIWADLEQEVRDQAVEHGLSG